MEVCTNILMMIMNSKITEMLILAVYSEVLVTA